MELGIRRSAPALRHRAICVPASVQACTSSNERSKEHLMLDILMLVFGFGLFAAGIGYAYACERL